MDNNDLAVGIDIGGTKTNIAVIDAKGNIKEMNKIKTNNDQPDKIKESLIKHIKPLIDRYKNIIGIGIASAGRVIFDKKTIGYATDNLKDWTEYPLADNLKKEFNLPILIDNDVNAALLAELKLNDSINERYKNIIFLTIGTGLGGALAFNGEIVRGNTGSVGEFGHMVLYPKGLACNCGKQGCAEQYISGRAYKRRLKKKLNKESDNIDKEALHDKTIEKEIFHDNLIYNNTLKEMTKDLSLLLENLKNVVDFDLCIIGGGFSVYQDKMLEIIKEEFKEYNHKYYQKPDFIFSTMGNKAGVIGAGLMIFSK